MSDKNPKKIYVFTGSNCVNCDALKVSLKSRKDLDISYFDFDRDKDTHFFSSFRVRGIPTVFQFYDWEEVEKTRQIGVIDLSKY